MICKKCANEFEDSLTACPECGEDVSEEAVKKKAFTVTINDDEAFAEKTNEEEAEEKAEKPQLTETKTEKPQQEETLAEEPHKVSYKEKRQAEIKRKGQEKLKAQRKKEKGASRFIVSSVCVMAVIMVALSILGIFTDLFEQDDDTVKTVALSSLSVADAAELEKQLSAIYVLRDIELDDDTASDELYPYFMPHSEIGIFRQAGNETKITTDTPDPAKRFADEDGNYSYYKIEAEKIDSLVERFGLIPNHTLNLKNSYYYEGNYYYAALEDIETVKSVEAEIVTSKRIQDGSYYLDCIFYSADSSSGRQLGEVYAIVSKKDSKWNISRISSEPLFDESGIMIENDGMYKYEMKRELFSGVLSDGTVFCEYSVEYPYFKGDSVGEKAVNLLYSEVLAQYKKSAEEADKHFENYKGKKQDLPIVVHISSEVTFNDEEYISTIVDIGEYNPEVAKKQSQTSEGEAAALAKRNVEGYIFDTETGEYVSRDAVIGKNYQLIADLLYRIHGGYTYTDLIDETVPRPGEIPPDNVIGKKIYESGGAITPNGYVFCLVTEDGYVESVLLRNDVLRLLV